MATKTAPPSDTLAKRRERLAGVEERIPALDAEIQTINAEIAAAIAAGKSANGLHKSRRELRDELEDLEAAMPSLRRLVQEAEEAVQAQRQDDARERMAALEPSGAEAFRTFLTAAHQTADALTAFTDLATSWGGAVKIAAGGRTGSRGRRDEFGGRALGIRDAHRLDGVLIELEELLHELFRRAPDLDSNTNQ